MTTVDDLVQSCLAAISATTATITRAHSRDGRWIYTVHGPNTTEHAGRSLVRARRIAAGLADTIVERWPPGKVWTKGPRGGSGARALRKCTF